MKIQKTLNGWYMANYNKKTAVGKTRSEAISELFKLLWNIN